MFFQRENEREGVRVLSGTTLVGSSLSGKQSVSEHLTNCKEVGWPRRCGSDQVASLFGELDKGSVAGMLSVARKYRTNFAGG